MTVFTKRAVDVYAPTTAGGVARGAGMGDAMLYHTEVERALDGASAGRVDQSTWAGLAAIAGTRAGQPAIVVGPDSGVHIDPVTGQSVPNVGEYYWSAAPAGWRRAGDLQRTLVHAINTGAGTANAVQAASDVQFSTTAYAALITVNFGVANTGAMTLAINGETPRPLVTNTGAAIEAGYVTAGMSALVQIDSDGNYRLFSYGDASAIQAVVEALLVEAQAARDAALSAQPQAFPVSRTALGALPDTTANAYLTESGFEGYFKQVDATDPALADLIAADTVGGDIKVSAGNPNLAWLRQRKYGDLIKSSEFGHDLTVALAVAGEQRKRFGPDARVDVLINQTGTLPLSTALQPPTGVNFFSDKNLEIDPSGLDYGDFYDSATGLKGLDGRTVIDIRPLAGTSRAGHYSAALPAFDPIAVGDISVNFPSGHGRNVGDVLVWHDSADGSWFAERPEYKLSMRRRVVGVASSTKLFLDKPARDAFTYSATCKAYVQTILAGGRFGGWRMDLEASSIIATQGIHLFGLEETTEVAATIAVGASYSGIAIAQCFGLRPHGLRGGTEMGTAGDSVYPIQIQNCTDVRVRDSSGAGDWHALAMTGAGGTDVGQTINEDCWFEDCKAYNTGGSIVGSIEMHGNSDRCGFLNCEASEAILGGRDASLVAGAIDNAQTDVAGQGKLVFIGEQHSGRFLIQGTRMRSVKNTGASSSSGAIYCYAGDNQVGEIFIDIRDVFIDAPNEETPILIGRGFGNNKLFSVSFDGVVNVPAAGQLITVPNFTAGVATSSYFRIERATGLTNGVPWAFFGNDGAGGPFAAFADMQFPKQKVEWVTSGVAAASEVSSAFNWPHAYPNGFVPPATVEIQKSTLGAKASAHLYDVTRTTVQAIVATGDGTNLGATATRVTIFGW